MNYATNATLWLSLLSFLGLFGCSAENKGTKELKSVGKTTGSSSSVNSSTAPPNDGDYLVGAVFPMSGPTALFGQSSIRGFKFALEKINRKGIHGRKIRLIIENNRGSPKETAKAVRKLINKNNVHVIFGSISSSNTLAGAPIAQNAQVPMMTPFSTNETVTQKGNYIFRICFTDNFQGVVMSKFARESLGRNKALVIVDPASDYSRGLKKVFIQDFKQRGGTVIEGEFTYKEGEKDFYSLLKKVQQASPDVVFIPGYYAEVGIILRQARQIGLHIPFLGGDAWDSPRLHELAGVEGIQGNYISSHFSSGDNDPIVQLFVKDYKKRFSQLPGATAALGYDSAFVLADALMRAKPNPTRDDIRQALSNVKGIIGVTGSITIDANRNARKPAVVLMTTAWGTAFMEKISPD